MRDNYLSQEDYNYFKKISLRIQEIGLGFFASGTLSLELLDLSEQGEYLGKSAVAVGLTMIITPLIREYQDYRSYLKDINKDDPDEDDQGGGGGWWFPEDEPPDIPDSPSGIAREWISNVEAYANSEALVNS